MRILGLLMVVGSLAAAAAFPMTPRSVVGSEAIERPTPAGTAPVRAPVVATVEPAPNSTSATPVGALELVLAQPIDEATFDASALSVYGRWSGVTDGATTLLDGGARIRFEPTRPFQAGEQVTASLRRGVATRSGGVLASGFTWSFWIRPDPGSLDLVEQGPLTVLAEGEKHVQPYGAYAGDFNADGYSDLAIPNEVTADVRIMLNDGQGGYSEFAVVDIPSGNWPSPNEGADFNRDGHVDLAVGNAGNDLVSIFLGDGSGGFTLGNNEPSGRNVRGICTADWNGDGWPDVASVNMSEGPRATRGNVAILLNDGTGRLERSTSIPSPGRGEKTCAVADANSDGVTDLFVGAYESDEVLLFLGDGEGGLAFHTKVPAGGNPWMIVAADVNGDGHVDALSANQKGDNVAVILGDGLGGMGTPTTYAVGEEPLAVDVGDLDGDGDLDVVTSDYAGNTFTVYENAGDGTLVRPRTYASGGSGSCAILHDRDRDGDLDMTGVDEKSDNIFIFENRGA